MTWQDLTRDVAELFAEHQEMARQLEFSRRRLRNGLGMSLVFQHPRSSAASVRETYRRKKARGECLRCSEPATPGRVHCTLHAILHRANTREAAAKRCAAGLCVRCAAPAKGRRCAACTADERAYRKKAAA